MADLEIRALTAADDLAEYLDLSFRAFGPADETRIRQTTEPVVADGRCLAAVSDGRLVAAAMFHDFRQWWRGRALRMAGVGGVKVAPEFRGRGIGRAVMAALTELMAERGYPLAALFPATAPLYRQLGWELAGARYSVAIPARSLLGLARPDFAAAAEVPLRRPGPDDAGEVLDVIGRAHQLAGDCGPVSHAEPVLRRWLTEPGRYADRDKYAYLAPDGFLAYRWRDGHDEIFVDKLVASSAQTTRALLSVLASHSSMARTVRAYLAPADPVWWLLREQDAAVAENFQWMLRLLDPPTAIAARGFPAVNLTVPLRIIDNQLPANSGLWDLTVRNGAGNLVRTVGGASPAPADARQPGAPLAVGARGLAALYAGTPVAALRRAGLVSGGSPGADEALDGAFAASAFMLDDF